MLKSSSFILAGIGSFIFLVFAYGRMGQIPFDKGVLICLAVFLMLYSARAFEVEMKYKSPKFVSNIVHSTANWSDIKVIGEYAVVKLGSVDAYGFKFKGGAEGTVVVKLDGLERNGESTSCSYYLYQIPLEALPPEVYAEKEYLGITEPLYRGDYSVTKRLPSGHQIETKERDKVSNMLQELLEGKTDVVEKYVEGSSRIIERRKGVGSFLKGIFSPERKEPTNEQE